jgi:lipopolysaccharide/colanic/teichoic acid biosynthesis glycosyltransferase
MLRHSVKGGMTGWAQVNGWRGDTSLEERLAHDLHYIENWTPIFDLKILLRTLTGDFLNRNA